MNRIEPIGDRDREIIAVTRVARVERDAREGREDERPHRRRPAPMPAEGGADATVPAVGDDGRPHIDVSA